MLFLLTMIKNEKHQTIFASSASDKINILQILSYIFDQLVCQMLTFVMLVQCVRILEPGAGFNSRDK